MTGLPWTARSARRCAILRFDALTNPHAREAARQGVTDGWFAGILPDLNMRDPRVSRYAIQQSLWWITLFGADGVRLDTYPMVDRTFWRDWSRRLKAAHPRIRVVGEAWVGEAADLSFFQGGREGWDGIDPGIDTVFDFPLYQAATAVFSGQAPVSALAQTRSRRDGLHFQAPRATRDIPRQPRYSSAGGRSGPVPRAAEAGSRLSWRRREACSPDRLGGDELGLPGQHG